MRVAIASGKGGTGKTTVAVNLALAAELEGRPVAYLDCDVEEPNGHLFLQPDFMDALSATTRVPKVDDRRCDHCGRCGEICNFSAIVCVGEQVLLHPELCHACGGCTLVCPTGAIEERAREVGIVRKGRTGAIDFVEGRLRIGEALAPPVIRMVRGVAPREGLAIVDAPPGTSCPTVESLRGCDLVLLVSDSTPFGLHDLKLAVDTVRALDLPFGVVLNRAGIGDDRTPRYCEVEGIEILAEIPEDRRVAEAYSRGERILEALPEYRELYAGLLERVLRRGGAP